MKILHSIFTHDDGGTERYVADLANRQVADGHEVTVMIRGDRHGGSHEDAFLQWLDEGVNIVALPNKWLFLKWPSLPIKQKLKQIKPDIIHTHHGRDSRYLAKLAGEIPVVATVHMHYREKDYRRHNGLICVSNWLVETVPSSMRDSTVLIPNWVGDFEDSSAPSREALRDKLNITEDMFLFGSVGRFSPEKAPDDLIEAYLQADIAKSHLLLFGEGEMKPKLEEMIAPYSDKITLMGYEKQIRPWYKAFDCFVLPSRSESFGLVLLEAMDAECPIITTRSEGAKDLLSNNEQVRMTETAAPHELAAAMQEIADKPRQRIHYDELSNHKLGQANEAILRFYQRFLV